MTLASLWECKRGEPFIIPTAISLFSLHTFLLTIIGLPLLLLSRQLMLKCITADTVSLAFPTEIQLFLDLQLDH